MKLFEALNQKPSLLQVIATIGWLCFLVATAASGIAFSLLDPDDLVQCASLFSDSSRTEIYSIGFFFFWLLTFTSSLLCYHFLQEQ